MAASGEAKIRAGETMEFTVNKADLVRELNLSQGVVEKKTTIPILSNVLLRADAASGGVLALSATDMDIEIVERVPLPFAHGRPPASGNALMNR